MNAALKVFAPTLVLALAAGNVFAASDVSGTYELLICKHACSFRHPGTTFAKGIIILFDKPMSAQEIERVDPFYFSWPNEVVRACFSGENIGHLSSFAFLQQTGVTPWSAKGQSLTFELFRSPDARYEVEANREGTHFVGKGISSGGGGNEPAHSPDVVVGRRTGPPSVVTCPSVKMPPAT